MPDTRYDILHGYIIGVFARVDLWGKPAGRGCGC
jgi:hypothetical protein